ncbi:hypothetical protein EV144_101805 [Flavobacterium sp. 270]|nr:hypothetical protein EV145_106161 [Flavobacterium sp. 245]TDW52122.1 hypothetical protein EV144_101805 [Flavobacterium sp. 270]
MHCLRVFFFWCDLKKGSENKKLPNILISNFLNKKWRSLSSIGAIWLVVTGTGRISINFIEDLAYYW